MIVVPFHRHLRIFVLLVDAVTTQPYLTSQMMFLAAALLGMTNDTCYFSVILMDALNISPILGEIFASIIIPAEKLGVVFYMFAIIVVIYAEFGMLWFPGDFKFGDIYGDDETACTTIIPWRNMSKRLSTVFR